VPLGGLIVRGQTSRRGPSWIFLNSDLSTC